MNLLNATLITAISTAIKLLVGLVVIKLLALNLGAEGLGQFGQFMSMMAILLVISTGGISKGIIRYVSENYLSEDTRLEYQSAGLSAVLVSSLSSGILLIIYSSELSSLLFSTDEYADAIVMVSALIVLIGISQLYLAIINGLRKIVDFAIINIIGSIVGVIVFILCLHYSGFAGAIVGYVFLQAGAFFPLFIYIIVFKPTGISLVRPRFHIDKLRHFFDYSIMTLVSIVALPIVLIYLRNIMAERFDWHEVGVWQGMLRLSDAYLQFVTVSLTSYYLPTITRISDKKVLQREVIGAIKTLLSILIPLAFIIYALRDEIISVLFTSQFVSMRGLFLYQLIGDILKSLCYVFGYIVIAKGCLKLYILNEFAQGCLLLFISGFLIKKFGAHGAVIGHLTTYAVLFLLSSSIFIFWIKNRSFD